MNKIAITELRLSLCFSSKLGKDCVKNYCNKTEEKTANSNLKKGSKPVYITLIGTDGITTVSNLESAVKIAKRRSLKLMKISDYDSVKRMPVYKLLSAAELLKDEILSKKTGMGKDNGLKSEKIISFSANISSHDLDSKLNQIKKWLIKKNGVSLTITGSLANNQVEILSKDIEETLKAYGKISQKKCIGSALKFHIIPLTED